MNELALLIGIFLLLCLIKVPIAFALSGSSAVILLSEGISLRVVVSQIYEGVRLFPLLAIPFFLMAGFMMNEGNLTPYLVKFSQHIVGRFRGGLAYINILVSMLFAGISGSSAADTSAVGGIMIPAMKQDGYDLDFSVAITAASSTMGTIIPPSIYMVVYGAAAGVSIGALFLAGIIPGVLVGLTQMLYTYYLARKHNFARYIPGPESSFFESFKKAILPLLMPVLIVAGITGGVFTATEAGAVAVIYGLFLVIFVFRTVKLKGLFELFKKTALFYPLPLFAIGSAGLFGWLISYLGAGTYFMNTLEALGLGPTGTLFFLSIILIVVGTFMSPVAAILVFIPFIQTIQTTMGFDPVRLGVLVCVSLSLGLITPPYGLCFLIACEIGELSVVRTLKALIPLIFIFIFVIVLLILFPPLTTFIPGLVY